MQTVLFFIIAQLCWTLPVVWGVFGIHFRRWLSSHLQETGYYYTDRYVLLFIFLRSVANINNKNTCQKTITCHLMTEV